MITIGEAIKILADDGGERYCKICIVDEVDQVARTVDVTPIDESAPILGVNLQANQSTELGVVAFPKKGSHVVVSFLNRAAAVVVLTEEIEKIVLKLGENDPVELEVADGSVTMQTGDTSIEIVKDKKITLNGGDLGGLVVIEELRASLNSLKIYCETMKSAVSAGIMAVNESSAASGKLGAKTFDSAMSSAKIEIKSMENTNIKHG